MPSRAIPAPAHRRVRFVLLAAASSREILPLGPRSWRPRSRKAPSFMRKATPRSWGWILSPGTRRFRFSTRACSSAASIPARDSGGAGLVLRSHGWAGRGDRRRGTRLAATELPSAERLVSSRRHNPTWIPATGSSFGSGIWPSCRPRIAAVFTTESPRPRSLPGSGHGLLAPSAGSRALCSRGCKAVLPAPRYGPGLDRCGGAAGSGLGMG